MKSVDKLEKVLAEIDSMEDGEEFEKFSCWELNFLDSMKNNLSAPKVLFSERQEAVIDELYYKLFR